MLVVFQRNMSVKYRHIPLKLISGLIARVRIRLTIPAPEPSSFFAQRPAIPSLATIPASCLHLRKGASLYFLKERTSLALFQAKGGPAHPRLLLINKNAVKYLSDCPKEAAG